MGRLSVSVIVSFSPSMWRMYPVSLSNCLGRSGICHLLSPDVVLLLDDLAVGVVSAVGAGRPRPRARRHDGEQQPGKVGGAEIGEETKRNS